MRSLSTATKPPLPAIAANGAGSKDQRLGALHRMSGALTHDFNNLLGVILSANERLAAELPEGGEQQKLALLSLEAAERGAELLRRALALAQGPEPEPETLSVPDVLATLKRLAAQAIGPGVRLTVDGPAKPLQCLGDSTGLEMALLNLCLNASQAMPDGGRLGVRARELRLDATDAARLGVAPGGYVAFTVRDSGAGMSPQTLARARDPLFTTKATGTGLGLSSVADVADAAGGALSLHSREGHGTTATLYMPVAATSPNAVAA
jgi:signal transduction histidine kinase